MFVSPHSYPASEARYSCNIESENSNKTALKTVTLFAATVGCILVIVALCASMVAAGYYAGMGVYHISSSVGGSIAAGVGTAFPIFIFAKCFGMKIPERLGRLEHYLDKALPIEELKKDN